MLKSVFELSYFTRRTSVKMNLYENESLQHFLSHDLGKMATLFVLKVRFFQRPFIMVSVFSQVQGPDQGPDQDLF